MKAPDIPLRYRTSTPADLATDLGRLATAIATWARELPSPRDALPDVGELEKDGATLSYGLMARVAPRDGQWMQLRLPVPNPRDGGRSLQVARLTDVGAVEIITSKPGCTVNGYDRIMLLGSVGITTISTDGANFFMDNAGALNWGAGL
jgi:hypothetical protein